MTLQGDIFSLARSFAQACEEEELHGLHFQHVSLCERRAWFHLHRIDYSHTNDLMKRGSALHDTHKVRDTSVEGLFGLSPDRVDWRQRVVYEAKGSSGAKDAVSMQTAFYAFMLTAHTGEFWRARTEIINQKRHRDVDVSLTMLHTLFVAADTLKNLKSVGAAPPAQKMKLCEKCSYESICWGTKD